MFKDSFKYITRLLTTIITFLIILTVSLTSPSKEIYLWSASITALMATITLASCFIIILRVLNTKTPFIPYIMHNKNIFYWCSFILLSAPLISIIFHYNSNLSFKIWLILMAVELDATRELYRISFQVSNPFLLIKASLNSAQIHIENQNINELYNSMNNIGAIAQFNYSHKNITIGNHASIALSKIGDHLMYFAEENNNGLIFSNIPAILSCLCENLENNLIVALNNNLNSSVEISIAAVRTVVERSFKVVPEYATIPLGCLHRCLDRVRMSDCDQFIIPATCVELAHKSVQILDHIDTFSEENSKLYLELTLFLEYFAPRLPNSYNEATTKSIIQDAFFILIDKLCQPPFIERQNLNNILKLIAKIIEQHLRSIYAQKDPKFYQSIHEKLDLIEQSLPTSNK